MPPTLEDVGRRCGVSRSTVSRVVNNSPLVNAETRERVLQAIREMGYVPNVIARSLTTRRTQTLAVALPDIAGGVFPELLAGMDEVASANGWHLLVVFQGGRRAPSRSVGELVRYRRADGVIAVASAVNEREVERLAEAGMAVVRVAQRPGKSRIPTVLFDNRGGARSATELLIRRGCRRVVHVTGPAGNYDAVERREGFREALRNAGLKPVEPSELRGDFLRQSGYEAVGRAWDRGVRFDGLFAGNDEMAIGALEALAERGVAVPDEVAVVGFDDIDAARFIGLSTVRLPAREMGRLAIELALQVVAGKKTTAPVLPAELVERASTQRGAGVRPVMMLRGAQ